MTKVSNINCTYYDRYGFCTHPSVSRVLGIFRRSCVKVKNPTEKCKSQAFYGTNRALQFRAERGIEWPEPV